jgi:hypothetical protein
VTAPTYASFDTRQPSVLPVLFCTLFLGVLGLVPTAMIHRRASAMHASVARYWLTFAATFVAQLAVTLVLLVVAIDHHRLV